MGINTLLQRMFKPIDTASLVVFRIGFGLLMFFSTLRVFFKGWIPEFYVKPIFHFTYFGFSWVQPWSSGGLHLHFGVLAALACCIAAGFFYRAATVLFFVGFTYIELLDKTYYLNHYYAITLFSFLLIFLPLHKSFSLDCLRHPSIKTNTFPQWVLWILQAQISIIYIFAGLAKLNADWLFHAQPLSIWLSSLHHIPVIGPMLEWGWVPFAMSWFGALYDITIPFFLLKKSTRPWAYAAVILFHGLTTLFFYIGVFPFVMMVLTLVFFSPDWPRRFVTFFPKIDTFPAYNARPRGYRLGIALVGIYLALQLLVPMRYLLYPGPLFWTEEGFRFSWRVMLIEKTGMIDFVVKNPKTKEEWVVMPRDYLTPLQAKMMATQPDMILQFAHFIGKTFLAKTSAVEVYAQSSYVSLNGRKSRAFIDPTVNLLEYSPSFAHQPFILPLND